MPLCFHGGSGPSAIFQHSITFSSVEIVLSVSFISRSKTAISADPFVFKDKHKQWTAEHLSDLRDTVIYDCGGDGHSYPVMFSAMLRARNEVGYRRMKPFRVERCRIPFAEVPKPKGLVDQLRWDGHSLEMETKE